MGGTFSGGDVLPSRQERSHNTNQSEMSREEAVEHRSKRLRLDDEQLSPRSRSPVKVKR